MLGLEEMKYGIEVWNRGNNRRGRQLNLRFQILLRAARST